MSGLHAATHTAVVRNADVNGPFRDIVAAPSGRPPYTQLTPAQLANLDHDDYGPRLNFIIWSLTFLSACFLFLRVYCKLARGRGLWWDDHLLIISWVFLTGTCVITSYVITLGYGKHTWDINPQNLLQLPLLALISGTLSIMSAVWSKTSFAITLLRISQGWTKITIWCIIIIINAAVSLSVLFQWISCSPIEKAWKPLLPGTCFPGIIIIRFNMFSAGLSGAADIILALLPWMVIWKLQLKTKEKIGVAIAMSMGIFAGMTSLIKVTKFPLILSGDIYDGVELIIWSAAESAVTIMAASVPILRALLKDRPPAVREAPVPYIKPVEPSTFGTDTRSSVTIQSLSGHSKRTSYWRTPRASGRFTRQASFDSSWRHPSVGEILQIREIDVEYGEKTDEEKAREETLKKLHAAPAYANDQDRPGGNIVFGHGMGDWK